MNAAAGRGTVAGRGAADAATSLPKGRLEEKIPDGKPTYTEGEAVAEANRCLYCHDAPCIEACPTGIDIPRFIRKISTGNTRGSAGVILSANLLGYSCARVCPVEVLCVGACVYNAWHRNPPIQIGRVHGTGDKGALVSVLTLQDGEERIIAERLRVLLGKAAQ